MTDAGRGDESVLVLAPIGRDAALACTMLTVAGIACRQCRDLDDLCGQPLDRAAAILLTEEVLSEPAIRALAGLLGTQPEWSDLPVIVFVDRDAARTGAGRQDLVAALGLEWRVIVIERPVPVASFVSVMRSAVLNRRRQYELRDQLSLRRQAEAHAQTLAREMAHRVKNSLAIVAAIASQTFRNAPSVDHALEAFSARLNAMGRAQDALVENGYEAAGLHDLIGQALDPYRAGDDDRRFAIGGPPVRVAAQTATMLAMAIHELATNAVKYGALSVDSGGVSIRWRVDEAEAGQLRLEWREHGGPPVPPPPRRGFGSRLIERSLAREVGGGGTKIAFEPDGVVCEMRAALQG